MGSFSNNLVITNNALTSISRELINKRLYKEDSIEKVGSPYILNGVASNFSSSDYLKQTGLVFAPDAPLSVEFQGSCSPIPESSLECVWKLQNGSTFIALFAGSNYWVVEKNGNIIINLRTIFNYSKIIISCVSVIFIK